MAAGYVGFRAFENVRYATSAMALLVMLSVSQGEAIRRAGAPDIGTETDVDSPSMLLAIEA